MEWKVEMCPEFAEEFEKLSRKVKVELLAEAELLMKFGPILNRPHADTLNGSKYTNMKELRFKADGGVWRVAYAFDLVRKGILLVAGDKSGVSEEKFYLRLVTKADLRFDSHLARMKG